MIAAVTQAPGHVAVVPLEVHGDVRDGMVRIRMERVGICGSDLHIFNGTHSQQHLPRVQGHEIVGIVDAIGTDRGDIAVGDRVVIDPQHPCGTCIACRRGRPNACLRLAVMGVHVDGGLRSVFDVNAEHVHPCGPLSADAAVFTEPVTIGIRSVERASLRRGERMLVLGAGSIGRAVTAVAALHGVRVTAADPSPQRRVLAEALGAESTCDLTESDVTETMRRFADGDGFLAVVNATGSASLGTTAVRLLAQSGTYVAVGISSEILSAPTDLIVGKELTIAGSRNSIGAFPQALDIVERVAEQLAATVSDRFGLAAVPDAMQFASTDNPVGKVIISGD